MSHDPLMDNILRAVRVEIRAPMQLKVTKRINGKERDSHIFEVELGTDPAAVQKEVQKIVVRWKGGFEVGTQYIVERLA